MADMADMANSTQSNRVSPSAVTPGGGRLLLDAGDDYLDLRDSREADPGAVTLSRQRARRYRDALLKSDEQLLQDQQELEKNRSELSSIRQKLDGLDGQISQLKQAQAQRQSHFLYALAALVAVGGIAWLIGRRSSLRQVAVVDSPFSDYDGRAADIQVEAMSSPSPSGKGRLSGAESGLDSAVGEVFFPETGAMPDSDADADVGTPATAGSGVHSDAPQGLSVAAPAAADASDFAGLSVTETVATEEDEWVQLADSGEQAPQPGAGQPEQLAVTPDDERLAELGGTRKPQFTTAGHSEESDAAAGLPAYRKQDRQTGASLPTAASFGATPEDAGFARGLSVSEEQPPAATRQALTDDAATAEGADAVIRDGLSAQEIDLRLSRLSRADTAERPAPGSKPPSAPVMMSGADMLPADVQQQIRVEQLLRALSGDDAEAAPSAVADQAGPPRPRPPRWRPGQPESEAVREGEPGVDFDLSDEKATLTHLPQWKTGRSLAATRPGEDASSILMQLDFPAASTAKPPPSPAAATGAAQERADDTDSGAGATGFAPVSAFASMEEINEALASDMVPLETVTESAEQTSLSDTAAAPPAAETGQAALTVYEEMVELKQPSTAFQYDDLGFEDSEQDTGGRLGREYREAAGRRGAATDTKKSARQAAVGETATGVGQTATLSVPKTPWYRRIFSKKQEPDSSEQEQQEGDTLADSLLGLDIDMMDVPDVDEETAAQQAEDRLAAVWQNSSDWMPAQDEEAAGQQVYDGIDLNPAMEDLGALRSRPDTGESMLGFLRHLYRQVTALKRTGDTGRARALLLEHLMVMPATSAWVYLEFLALTDAGDSDGLVVSSRFKEQFNRFPPVDRAKVPGLAVRPKTLMEYDQALHSLSNVWPQEQARDLLDRWLAGYASNMRLFSLHAYRELFLLYEILDDRLAAGGEAAGSAPEVDIALF